MNHAGTSPTRSRSTLARLALFAAAAAVAVTAGIEGRQDSPSRQWLAQTFDLSPGDVQKLGRGEVVVETLHTNDSREVATLGIVAARLPAAFYAERAADIAVFKKHEAVLQIGTFSSRPQLSDVAGLTLETSDIRGLGGCRVGHCDLQLSAEAINRFRAEIDWDDPGATAAANQLMREVLVDYVTRYSISGASAMMQYADRRSGTDLRKEYQTLLDSDTRGIRHFPSLQQHLAGYPQTTVPGATDVIYWSKEQVGRKTVVNVTHLVIAEMPAGSSVRYVIASKNLYGSHYIDASLGLTILLADGSRLEPVTYVAYVNRSRVDVFGGLLGGVTRGLVRSRAKSTVSNQLGRLRGVLETQFAQVRAATPLHASAPDDSSH